MYCHQRLGCGDYRYCAKAVESAAAIDQLTGLPSRKVLDIGMTMLLQKSLRYKTTLGIIRLDLEPFKAINDTHAHLAGDFVLAKTA